MRALMKKIHMYIGLLNFSNLMVFGVAGLAATFQGGPQRREAAEPVRYENFTPPPGATDRQIADLVFARFRLPLADPFADWAIHRDPAGNLPLEFWTVNGTRKVVYLPQENRVQIETVPRGLPFFLDDIHTVTELKQKDWRMRLWAYYNQFAIWSLLAMAVTGVYLWLASRPSHRIAQYSLLGGVAIFVLLYAATR